VQLYYDSDNLLSIYGINYGERRPINIVYGHTYIGGINLDLNQSKKHTNHKGGHLLNLA
jgi:hypothetical protein